MYTYSYMCIHTYIIYVCIHTYIYVCVCIHICKTKLKSLVLSCCHQWWQQVTDIFIS